MTNSFSTTLGKRLAILLVLGPLAHIARDVFPDAVEITAIADDVLVVVPLPQPSTRCTALHIDAFR
jgi:hypothetical protein